MSTALLKAENLSTRIFLNAQTLFPVNNLTFEITPKEILCIIGESGCGKTLSMLSLTNLLPKNARISSGKVMFQGAPLDLYNEKYLTGVRGAKISYIFQDPTAYLNPIFTIGEQIQEAIRFHSSLNTAESKKKVFELLDSVGLRPAQKYYAYFPHQLSGGMNQRAMIAMAIASQPQLLIADEPTSSLDRITELKILRLLLELNKTLGLSIILITHNIAIVKGFAHRIAIMYAGSIIEEGTTDEILTGAQHPYTKALLACLPQKNNKNEPLKTIRGSVPDPSGVPQGCSFHPRCDMSKNQCLTDKLNYKQISKTHFVRCC